ncbi:MarR family winged helix-turn-helix transcriptional regulator [Nocardioides aurantiacus]|uniref:MarR family winged helix-turn-helix transcriptional regulator n=1 Tax=Nocardioides aurantiacus TaxID=86796 RepID=UPI00403F1A09
MAVRDQVSFEIGQLVKETQSVLRGRMDEALRPLGLTMPQYVCLATLLEHPGATSSELARRGYVTRQTLSVLMKGLVERGLVVRSEHPGPRRELAVQLTEEARALVSEAHGRVAGVANAMTAHLDPAQAEQLRDALVSCRDALLAGNG